VEAYAGRGEILSHPDTVKGLAAKRNWILRRFEREDAVVMLDDDLTGLARLSEPPRSKLGKIVDPALIEEIIANDARLAAECGCFLFGWQAADHPEYYSGHKPIALTGFVNGCAIGFRRGHGLSFDERIVAKEDFDISAANAYRNRKCFRDLRYAFCRAPALAGGQYTIRRTWQEKTAVEELKRKWGEVIAERPGAEKRKEAYYIGPQKIDLRLPF
jgi:hypothetical protein